MLNNFSLRAVPQFKWCGSLQIKSIISACAKKNQAGYIIGNCGATFSTLGFDVPLLSTR